MSKQLNITVPDVVYAALAAKGKPFDLTAGEFLKGRLMMSVQGADVPLGLASYLTTAQEPEVVEQLVLGGVPKQ
jgi:hypothetical protein